VEGRAIAIGDIHGCADALAAVLDSISPTANDTIITLGDHIDRGPNSRQVVERLIALGEHCKLVSLIGNHEAMLLDAFRDSRSMKRWLSNGGLATMKSYGWECGAYRRQVADWIPDRHWEFLNGCERHFETDTHLFVHAGYVAELPLAEQPDLALQWRMSDPQRARPHSSGKVAIVGHTAQSSGEILDLGFLICIDTNCFRGGWLTALDVDEGRIWQASSDGRLLRLHEVNDIAPKWSI
jgi:serine/threonine protein phosphatase 1